MLTEKLKQAIRLIKAGEKENARKILIEILDSDPSNETAWLWFIDTLGTNSEKIIALQGFLKINPNSQAARAGLARLTAHLNMKPQIEPLHQEPAPLPPLPPAAPSVESTSKVVFNRDSQAQGPVENTKSLESGVVSVPAEIEKRPQASMHPVLKTFLRVLIIFFAILITGGGIFLYMEQTGLVHFFSSPCKCNETDAYLLRVEDRVTRWMTNQAIYQMVEKNGDTPQNTDFAQKLYDEEKADKVPECLKSLHGSLLLTFEYHLKYGEALKKKDSQLIQYYRVFGNSMQEQLKGDFENLKKNLVCMP